MNECIFCKIVNGEIPCEKLYEDDDFLAFNDIAPKAETHMLVIPKLHIESLAQLTQEHAALMGSLTVLLPKLAQQQGLTHGFRTVINTGVGGGQEVFHLHYHILGGSNLRGF